MVTIRGLAGNSFTWQIGTPFPSIHLSTVVSVTASGDELDKIDSEFTGIPMCKTAREVTWYGDMAKFILGNL